MAIKIDTIPRRHLVRRCMMCGYDGPAMRLPHTTHCVLCGCDLAQRPARSYAELEGFIPTASIEPAPPVGLDPQRAKLMQRWVAFIVFAGCALATLIYLAFAALLI